MAVESYDAQGYSQADYNRVNDTISAVADVVNDIGNQIQGATTQLQQRQVANVSGIGTNLRNVVQANTIGATQAVSGIGQSLYNQALGQLSQASSLAAIATTPPQAQQAQTPPTFSGKVPYVVHTESYDPNAAYNSTTLNVCVDAIPADWGSTQPPIFDGTLSECVAYMQSLRDPQGNKFVYKADIGAVVGIPMPAYGPPNISCIGSSSVNSIPVTQLPQQVSGVTPLVITPPTATKPPTLFGQPILPLPVSQPSITAALPVSTVTQQLPQQTQPLPITFPVSQQIPQQIVSTPLQQAVSCPPPVVNCNCPNCNAPLRVDFSPDIHLTIRGRKRKKMQILACPEKAKLHSDGTWEVFLDTKDYPDLRQAICDALDRINSDWETEYQEEQKPQIPFSFANQFDKLNDWLPFTSEQQLGFKQALPETVTTTQLE